MKHAYCSTCRFFIRGNSILSPVRISWCGHPDATKFSRVHGPYPPTIEAPDLPPNTVSEAVTDCDREGRYEEKPKPWWMPRRWHG